MDLSGIQKVFRAPWFANFLAGLGGPVYFLQMLFGPDSPVPLLYIPGVRIFPPK